MIPAGYTSGAEVERRLARLLTHGGVREEIGRSREGRPIFGYSWNARAAGAGGILLVSLLHPMEWIGLETHLALLEGWLLPGAPGPEGTEAPPLPPGTPIYSVPIANPDGYVRVERSLDRARPRWIRGNTAGVDLNRNFPVGHRSTPGLFSWWPLYRGGPSPASEPETAALTVWTRGRNLRLALSLHSFGRRIFYPPCRHRRATPEAERHRRALVEAGILGGPRTPYRAGQLGRWSPLFRAYGTEIDFLEAQGALAYLIEVSGGGFGRWGWRRLAHPFYLFNPPHPERELSVLLPLLRRLAADRCAPRLPAENAGRT
jgi:hypothetical protein